jgi:hypothetical protein
MAYKNLVKYRIDLKSVFNRTFPNREVKRGLYPLISDPMIKRAYGLAVIDEIIGRTQDERIDKNDTSFEKYSKSYARSLVGQVYGKRAGVIANLTLTGEMLASMDVQDAGKTEIYIKFVDETNAAKAHGHIHGIKRLDASGGKVVRDFFGLPKPVEEKILKGLIVGKRQEEMLLNVELLKQIESQMNINKPGEELGMEFGVG